jgi:hypothetical protein
MYVKDGYRKMETFCLKQQQRKFLVLKAVSKRMKHVVTSGAAVAILTE